MSEAGAIGGNACLSANPMTKQLSAEARAAIDEIWRIVYGGPGVRNVVSTNALAGILQALLDKSRATLPSAGDGKDSERLDWLDSEIGLHLHTHEPNGDFLHELCRNGFRVSEHPDLRAAIDLAMGREPSPPPPQPDWLSVFTEEERNAIRQLGEKQELSPLQVLRCGLRDYQIRVMGMPDLGPKAPPQPVAATAEARRRFTQRLQDDFSGILNPPQIDHFGALAEMFFANASQARIEELERELKTKKLSDAWVFIQKMTGEGIEATKLSKEELATALRREITDHLPMNSRVFALVDEASERLSAMWKDYFVPIEQYDQLKAREADLTAAIDAIANDDYPEEYVTRASEAESARMFAKDALAKLKPASALTATTKP